MPFEYLSDGYSVNISKIIKNNPKGYIMFAKQRMNIVKSFWQKLKASSQYVLGKWLLGEKNIFKNTNNKLIILFSVPFALTLYLKKYIRYVLMLKKGE
jgi:hypothetical protein